MKCLILSDIHGEKDVFFKVLAAETYDIVISLGDSELTASELSAVDVLIHGNAWMDHGQPLVCETFAGLRTVMTHGHHYQVHRGDEKLYQLLAKHKAILLMHGHTHVARFEKVGPYYFLNPGAISGPRGHWPATYAILEIEEPTFTVTFKTLHHTVLQTEQGVFSR